MAITVKSICSQAAAIKREIQSPYDRQSVIKRCQKLEKDRKTLRIDTTEALTQLRAIFIHLKLDTFKERILRVSLLSRDPENQPLFKKALDGCIGLERDLQTNRAHFDPQDDRAFQALKVKSKAFFSNMHSLHDKRTSVTTKVIRLARSFAFGTLGGIVTRSLGWNYPATLLATGIGTIAEWKWTTLTCNVVQGNSNAIREGSIETKSSNLLGEFFNDPVMTPERMDAAQREKDILGDGFIKLGSTSKVLRSQDAFLKVLKELRKGEGVVITDAKKTKAFSIGIETNSKGKIVVALFDPASNSCFYCRDIQDAAGKAHILTNGMTECSIRKISYDQAIDVITQEPIAREDQVRMGIKISHIGNEMVHLVTLIGDKGLTGQFYTKDDLSRLIKKACEYFAPARTKKPLTIQEIARVFLIDKIALSKNEDEALQTLVNTLTLPQREKRDCCNSERLRKLRFRELISASRKITEEDLISLSPSIVENSNPIFSRLPSSLIALVRGISNLRFFRSRANGNQIKIGPHEISGVVFSRLNSTAPIGRLKRLYNPDIRYAYADLVYIPDNLEIEFPERWIYAGTDEEGHNFWSYVGVTYQWNNLEIQHYNASMPIRAYRGDFNEGSNYQLGDVVRVIRGGVWPGPEWRAVGRGRPEHNPTEVTNSRWYNYWCYLG